MSITLRIGSDFSSDMGRYDSRFGGAHKTAHSPAVHDPYDIQDGVSGAGDTEKTGAASKAQDAELQKVVELLMMILALLKQMMGEAGNDQGNQDGQDQGVQPTKGKGGRHGAHAANGGHGGGAQPAGGAQGAGNGQGGGTQAAGTPQGTDGTRSTGAGGSSPAVDRASSSRAVDQPSSASRVLAAGGAGGLSDAALANNPAIAKYGSDIATASKLAGVPAEHIGATIWAESRGNQNTSTTNPGDGHADVGLMQISQNTWDHDVMPNLSAQHKANIKAATGKDASQLDMNDAHDNIIGGSFHLRDWINRAGGDLDRGHGGYVGGNLHNGGSTYVQNINAYVEELKNGEKLQEDPAGQAGRLG